MFAPKATRLIKGAHNNTLIRLTHKSDRHKKHTKFQSGFRPGDSTINRLIFLVHKIYEALEGGKEARVVFLDISKAFDKVWHAGLLRKLGALGVQSPLLQWFESYLRSRKQRVVIEGHCSDFRTINSGVPHARVCARSAFISYLHQRYY